MIILSVVPSGWRASSTVLLLALAAGCGSEDSQGEPDALASGEIRTWAGTGRQGHNGDGKALTETYLNQPMELAFGPTGRAYIVDWNNHAIRAADADGTVVTLVGQPLPGDWPCQNPMDPENCEVPLTNSIPAAVLALNHPMDVVPRSDDTFLYAAWHNHKIQLCDGSEDTVRVLSGQQAPGFVGDDGPAAAARLNFPDSLAIDETDAILVADERNQRIRRIDADGAITTVAGGVAMGPGFIGEGVPAKQAQFALAPYDEAGGSDNPPPGGALALADDGTLYVADTSNHCVRKLSPGSDGVLGLGDPAEEIVSTVAGTCGREEGGYAGDGGEATRARLKGPHDLEFGPDGALYIADTENHVVRRVDADSGVIITVAGTGLPGFSGDGGPATKARLRRPYGIAFDERGDLYIVDTMNNRIRRVAR